MIDKQQVLDMISQRDPNLAQQAEQQLPQQIDPMQHAGMLQQFGVNPEQLMGQGGQMGQTGGYGAGGFGGQMSPGQQETFDNQQPQDPAMQGQGGATYSDPSQVGAGSGTGYNDPNQGGGQTGF